MARAERTMWSTRSNNRLLNPRHVLAAADADRAAFDTDRCGAKLEQTSRVTVTVVDVVKMARHRPGPSGTRP